MALVAHWKLDNDYTDASGNGLALTPVGSPTFTTSAKVGTHALSLLRSSQQHAYADGSGLSAGAATITAWIRPRINHPTGQNWIICEYGSSGSNRRLLYIQSNDKARAFSQSGSIVIAEGTQTAWLAGVWYHLAAVFEPSVATRLYVDGSLAATAGYLGISAPTYARLGYDAPVGTPGNFFDGDIDDFYIYNSALTAEEINNLPGLKSGYPELLQRVAALGGLSVRGNTANASMGLVNRVAGLGGLSLRRTA